MRDREVLNGYNRKYYKTTKGKDKKSKNKEKRRARKLSSPLIENFTHKEIFGMNHYVCCICGLVINPFLNYPDKLSASLEHCVPLSKNGEHSFDNCKPAHLLCNIKKGARLLENNMDGAGI